MPRASPTARPGESGSARSGRTPKRLNLSLMLLAVASACTACATRSYTPDTPSEARQLNIRNGDEIRVLTTNRGRLTLKVEQVQEDRLVGVTIEPNVKEKLALPMSRPATHPYFVRGDLQAARTRARQLVWRGFRRGGYRLRRHAEDPHFRRDATRPRLVRTAPTGRAGHSHHDPTIGLG